MTTSTHKPVGGWAFPGPASGGMTLRDHFAGLAMQGIVGSIDSEQNYERILAIAVEKGMTASQWIATDAYKQADAMIAARNV